MKIWLVVLIVSGAVAGCDSPHPKFMGIAPHVVTVGGSTFSVRVKGNEAEAIRTDYEYIPRIGQIFPRAVAAIEQASGCKVVVSSVTGDSAYVRARVKCAS